MLRRILPAIGLFFLAPLVAEYLLGDIPITMIGALLFLAPMYGGGALLIREIVRRAGRGWPSIMVLALAYAILEEAFMTETLFNPNYLGLNLHLLDHAYIPAFGMGVWWTVFVLTLHTVWSISTSIALVEAMVPDRATEPWLRNVGLGITTVLFTLITLGSAFHSVKQDQAHFVASTAQFTWAGILFVAVATAAFLLPKRSAIHRSGLAPDPWVVGGFALVASSLFLIAPPAWGWKAVTSQLALVAMAIVVITFWSHRSGWDGRHRLALAGGAALTYAWHAFFQHPAVGNSGVTTRIGNTVFASGLVILLIIAACRVGAGATRSSSNGLSFEG